MDRPIVFLSHTSRPRAAHELRPGDTLSRHQHRKSYLTTLLDHLVVELERESLTPWRDSLAVEPGTDFQPELALGLARCDAAVLLIDVDALGPGVMAQEAVFLAWRKLIEPDLQVVPVLLGGVSAKEFAQSPLGAAADLASRTSTISIQGTANARTAPEHARDIVAALRVRPVADPVARAWIEDMEALLDHVPASVQRRAARALGIADSTWTGLRRQSRTLSAALLRTSLVDGIKVFDAVQEHLPTDAARQRVGSRITPLWVDLRKASVVARHATEGSRLLLGTSSLELASHAVQRGQAHRPGLQVHKLMAVGGEQMGRDLLEEWDATLRTAIGLLPDDTPDEIRASLSDTDTVAFALIEADGVPAKMVHWLVSTLSTRLPGVVFVLVAPLGSRAYGRAGATRVSLTRPGPEEREVRRHVMMLQARMGRKSDD